MKKITKHLCLLIISMLFVGFACMAQNAVMKTYVIERDIPEPANLLRKN